MAHTIYQALAFDAALQEEGFRISGTSASTGLNNADRNWDGTSEVILGKKEWFEAWLEGEKKCEPTLRSSTLSCTNVTAITGDSVAEDQYHEIISAPEAWLTADDGTYADSELRSTHSARRMKALVEQVTGKSHLYFYLLPRGSQIRCRRPLLPPTKFHPTHAVLDIYPVASP